MIRRNIAIIALVIGLLAVGYLYLQSSGTLIIDVTKPWWKGDKVVIIHPEDDPGNSFEVYAKSDGNKVLSAKLYQDVTFSSSECGKDSTSRFCFVTDPNGDKLRITPHPTGKIE